MIWWDRYKKLFEEHVYVRIQKLELTSDDSS